jgi:hypothetical protein
MANPSHVVVRHPKNRLNSQSRVRGLNPLHAAQKPFIPDATAAGAEGAPTLIVLVTLV